MINNNIKIKYIFKKVFQLLILFVKITKDRLCEVVMSVSIQKKNQKVNMGSLSVHRTGVNMLMCYDVYNITDLKTDLNYAIDNEEFYLCYQPLINTKTNKMIGMEALLRWNHPHRGKISPKEFIPIAEETMHIIPIGEWVIRQACNQLKSWHNMGYNKYIISVNVSVIQLQQKGFARMVLKTLEETGLTPEYLQLEITETVHMEYNSIISKNLMRLKRQGIKFSIDDFGTGYNSLNYLQSIEVDNLKIDKSFIDDFKSKVNQSIIEMIILLGHKINAAIIAEGVETKEQYEFLKQQECDIVQGYYVSEPLLPEEMTELFDRL